MPVSINAVADNRLQVSSLSADSRYQKGHIGVDLVYRVMPAKVQWALDIGISLVCAVFFMLVAWQSYLYAGTMKRVGQVSTTIQFPIQYVLYCMFLGTLVLAIVIFAEFINTLRGKRDE